MIFQSYVGIKEYKEYELPCLDICLSEIGSVCPKKNFFNGCTYQKMLVYKVVTFLKRIKMAIGLLIFLDQICPKWTKLDQIGFITDQKMLL